MYRRGGVELLMFSDSVLPNPESTDAERPWGWNKG